MRTHRARRVLLADRRGSSLPVLVETDDGRLVVKLRGAAHGTAALAAEILVAELARALGLLVPARSLVVIDEKIESENRDPELLELLVASRGLNLGFEFLEGARDFRAADVERMDADLASAIVWLDGLVMNPDRTLRNPNLLVLRGKPWLIDHGSTLGFHHDWSSVSEDAPRRADFTRGEHLLERAASRIEEWDEVLAGLLSGSVLEQAAAAVPDDFLAPLVPAPASAEKLDRRRAAYVAFLWKRLAPPRPFVPAPALGFPANLGYHDLL